MFLTSRATSDDGSIHKTTEGNIDVMIAWCWRRPCAGTSFTLLLAVTLTGAQMPSMMCSIAMTLGRKSQALSVLEV
jgi:hypothetical protein